MQTVLPSQFKQGPVPMRKESPQVLENLHRLVTAQTTPRFHGIILTSKTSRVVTRVSADSLYENLPGRRNP